MEFYGQVAYHDYEGVSLDLDERQRLVRDLGDKPVMILRNHGLLTVGSTPQQAFLRMYYLEKACQIQVAVQAGGTALRIPPQSVCEHAERQLNGSHLMAGEGNVPSVTDGNDLAWAALLRLLERIDPSYKD